MNKPSLELIDVLREELNAAGLCFAVDRSEDLTESVLRRLVGRIGGMHVYVRKNLRSRQEVGELVLRDFDGTNHQQLARRHGVSLRGVYRMLKAQKCAD